MCCGGDGGVTKVQCAFTIPCTIHVMGERRRSSSNNDCTKVASNSKFLWITFSITTKFIILSLLCTHSAFFVVCESNKRVRLLHLRIFTIISVEVKILFVEELWMCMFSSSLKKQSDKKQQKLIVYILQNKPLCASIQHTYTERKHCNCKKLMHNFF